ncbi:MAG: UvrD-helicase domain-containing protein, partial [Lysobacter sp.]
MNEAMRDPYLTLELDGLRLIEASAGTGKTFTLATLVTRLVIERGLRVGEILAVTFTEAATQELRERLRQRLVLAARVADGDPALDSGDDSAEVAITRALIRARLQQEAAASLRVRLQRAAREIDLAAVFTIHGFCARVLGEHALETGQTFIAPEMIGSDRELRNEIAADLWRSLGTDPVFAELLQAHWPTGPEALATDLGALLRAPTLLPPAPMDTPDPLPKLQQAAVALREAIAQHGDDARSRLDAALSIGVIDGRKAKKPSYEKAWLSLTDGAASGRWSRESGGHLDKLTPLRLRECAKAGREQELPTSPVFTALGDWFAVAIARDEWLDARGIALLHRVRDEAAT